MSPSERETAREYLARWQRVGPQLAAIRRRELRAYDFETNRELVDQLLQMAAEHAKPRKSSGLMRVKRVLRELRP